MADEKVLAAQEWVNATYSMVPGYVKCPEDGRTGWSTMFSLTMALQATLGMAPLVASFGPGTLSELAKRGDIGPNEQNVNIKKIVEHALFCKGYWGGDGTGSYGAATDKSVRALKNDAGLDASNGLVSPKVFKALLSMDAYISSPNGGTDTVRAVQRWLNGRYFSHSSFFVGPADGVYSRDVQKSLMKAIQYELGIPDDQATGAFGPGTQAGLKAHTVKEGDSGIWAQLFSAACVFNSPIPNAKGDSNIPTTFRDKFDSKLTEWVKAFQSFSELDTRDGRGDYRTWAQLLVSTGDPDRTATACDTRFQITRPRADALYKAGYRYVGRYLFDPPGSTLDKEIKDGELADIFAAGLNVFPIYQDNARRLQDFTFEQGFEHALNAHACADGYGFNRGTVIYFACDYDATTDEIASNIVPYFQGVQAGLANRGKKYVHGVYGSRNVCTQVSKNTDARYSFVSGMSWGFSGNLGFPLPPNWAFNQVKEFKFIYSGDSFDLDNDVHRSGSDTGQNTVHQQVQPANEFVKYITTLFPLALQYGKGDPNQLVMEYGRQKAYAGFKWWALIGSPDEDYIKFANSRGASLLQDFKDPVTGYTIGAEHLLAAANGHYVKPQQEDDIRKIGEGDIAGWAGDLITLYGEWRRDVKAYPSGYTYCQAKFGKIGVVSTFSFNDLIEDADGYLIARRAQRGGQLVDIVREHYGQGERDAGALTRFRDYFEERFGGSTDFMVTMARSVLLQQSNPKIAIGRTSLIRDIAGSNATLPEQLSDDVLNGFCRGFADGLHDRVLQEANAKGL
ncbi:glycoside hydrolase domain-containing protein [Streptomyces sp. NPDC023838]|uniref:glycoside hydrolase domain-containing protein n=1 Tax=Streptomyces sp. NPDC023838 TaxID=3154325 RepID=UPI003401EE13